MNSDQKRSNMTEVQTNLFADGGIVKAIERNYILSNGNKDYLRQAISEHRQCHMISAKDEEYLTTKYLND